MEGILHHLVDGCPTIITSFTVFQRYLVVHNWFRISSTHSLDSCLRVFNHLSTAMNTIWMLVKRPVNPGLTPQWYYDMLSFTFLIGVQQDPTHPVLFKSKWMRLKMGYAPTAESGTWWWTIKFGRQWLCGGSNEGAPLNLEAPYVQTNPVWWIFHSWIKPWNTT